MTARESIANYESKLREYTNFAVRGIKKVCKECGPRPSASEEERKAQEMMQKDLETCCDKTWMESFKTAPKAFMLWVRSGVLAGLAAMLAYNLGYAIVGLALLVLEVLFIVLEFILYKQAVDWLLPKKQSQNLIAVRNPSGEKKRRIILCGHADSANEWSYTYWGYKYFKTPKLSMLVVVTAIITLFFGIGISVAAVVAGKGWVGVQALETRSSLLTILGYVFAGLCVLMLSGWMFERPKLHVIGANDNLSGCFTAMGTAKMLGDLNLRLENTELMVICGGCEEIGLRGAKDFCDRHAKEYEDVETIYIALDTMTDFEYMGIYIRDLNMTVKHDHAVAALMRKAANTAGYDLPYENLFFGSSDATAATQAGMRAATFAAMNPAPADYYHTRLDTADNLNPKTIEACLDITMETIYQFDQTGLAPFEDCIVKVAK